MIVREIPWPDDRPSGSVELIPEGDEDHQLMARLERLRLVEVGMDFIRAARDPSIEGQVRAKVPEPDQQGPLSPEEGLLLLRLGPGMDLARLSCEDQLDLARGLGPYLGC